jgi:hypothetical protein
MSSDTENNNSNNDDDNNNNTYANVVNNFFRFITNAEQNPKVNKERLADFKQKWLRESNKRPTLFAKIWSDNPELFKEAKQEYAMRLAELQLRLRMDPHQKE